MSTVTTQSATPATAPANRAFGFLKGTWEGTPNVELGPTALVIPTGSVDAYTFTNVSTSNPLPARNPSPGSASLSNVNDSNSNQTLLSSNANRLGFVIYNDSIHDLYIKYGATASTTSFTHKIGSGESLERMPCYTGQIDGIWAADGTGAARITELS